MGPHTLLFSARFQVSFDRINVEQGLSQATVLSVCQDRRGLMWFGTEDGLNKYDGYNFVIYRNNPDNPHSLSDDYIDTIYEDSSGTLWIGTAGGGLNKYHRRKDNFTHYLPAPRKNGHFKHNHITSIFEDRSGIFWVGTEGGGLAQFDRDTGTFTFYRHNPKRIGTLSSNRVGVIFQDQSGLLWIGTNGGGLDKLDPKTGHFTNYNANGNIPGSISSNDIRSIYETQNRTNPHEVAAPGEGILLIGTSEQGLNVFDRSSETFTVFRTEAENPYSISSNFVSSITEDNEGRLWVGTWGGGLNTFDMKRKHFTHYRSKRGRPCSISHDAVLTVYRSKAGVLWIGTWGGGVNKLDLQKRKLPLYAFAGNGNSGHTPVRSICDDHKGNPWIATENGVFKFNRKKDSFRQYLCLPPETQCENRNNVQSVYCDGNGTLWLGTAYGLGRLEEGKKKIFYYSPIPAAPTSISHHLVGPIIEDREGLLWVGTENGLNSLNRQTGKFTRYLKEAANPYSLNNNTIKTIYVDRSGVLWIGTPGGGLSRFNHDTGEFTHYLRAPNRPYSLLQDKINVIYEDKLGAFWLGTQGGGLNKFDRKTKVFTNFSTRNGLANNVIRGILEDKKNQLWLCTAEGLTRFTPRNGTFRNYDSTDGLQDNEFNAGAYFKNSKGEMFFGGSRGFNAFFPGDIKDNPYVPPILLTSLKTFNKTFKLRTHISEAEELRVDYRQTVLSFTFAALCYSAPEKNQYAYMVDQYHKDWVPLGDSREITLAHLEPGDYTFRVKGSNNDNVWNEKGISLKIIVLGPFWRTTEFKIIMFLFTALAVFWFSRIRLRTVNRQKIKLEVLVTERTTEINRQKDELAGANGRLKKQISERLEAEKALADSEEQYRSVVERANDGILIIQGTKIKYLNPQLAQMAGKPAAELLEKSFYELVQPGERSKIEAIYNRRMAGQKAPDRYEATLTGKDGEKGDVIISVGKVHYQKKSAILVFVQDITERKQLERERIRAGKLESAGIMAGGIAHDFNNLLAVVIGNINLAKMTFDSDLQSLKILERSEKAALLAADLAGKFITFSEGEEPLKKNTFIGGIIKDAVDFALVDSQTPHQLEIAADLYSIPCDREQIYQVVSNLSINAMEALEGVTEGKVEIHAQNVTLEKQKLAALPAGQYVKVSISDNGVGIAEENMGKIFDPYFSTKSNVTKKGLGLGLSIVYSIVRKHGGYINVDSKVGIGTAVDVYLPASEDAEE
ncbi:MAG: PAS domain S-box protein [bacterium]|nr:PAS domain S-box protein [bacterium]